MHIFFSSLHWITNIPVEVSRLLILVCSAKKYWKCIKYVVTSDFNLAIRIWLDMLKLTKMTKFREKCITFKDFFFHMDFSFYHKGFAASIKVNFFSHKQRTTAYYGLIQCRCSTNWIGGCRRTSLVFWLQFSWDLIYFDDSVTNS